MSNIHTFKQILREYDCIVIPKIQRDYAQGRNTEKAKDLLISYLEPHKALKKKREKYFHL